jgi:GNAT superfamily N-acetyltransferase
VAGVTKHLSKNSAAAERGVGCVRVIERRCSGEIPVLALLPEWEGTGIGKKLLEMMSSS